MGAFQQSASESTRHKADVAEGLLSGMEKMEKKLERLERDNSNLAHQKSDLKKQNKALEDSVRFHVGRNDDLREMYANLLQKYENSVAQQSTETTQRHLFLPQQQVPLMQTVPMHVIGPFHQPLPTTTPQPPHIFQWPPPSV